MSISTIILKKADAFLKKQFKAELRAQGHYLTGGLENSINGQIVDTGNAVGLLGTAAGYGGILNAGTPSSSVPFGGSGGSKGGTSKYIQGLITFWKLRGLNEKQAMSAAFATAKKQKKEGMPTNASYAYARNKKRKYFILNVKAKTLNPLTSLIKGELTKAFFNEVGKTKSERI